MSFYVKPKPDDGDRLRHDGEYDWGERWGQGRRGSRLHQRASRQEVDEDALHLVQDAQHDSDVEQLVAEKVKIVNAEVISLIITGRNEVGPR